VTTRPDGSPFAALLDAVVAAASTSRTTQYTVPSDACPTTLTTHSQVRFADFVGETTQRSDDAQTRVLDVTPPTIGVSLRPAVLSPPNHKLRSIVATVTVEDECDPHPQVRLLSIVSNEPDNGQGDGDTPGDIQQATINTDDRTFLLRAERSGRGNGRTYTVLYAATDASGNAAQASAVVRVPRN
jgi:hypothetical protein